MDYINCSYICAHAWPDAPCVVVMRFALKRIGRIELVVS